MFNISADASKTLTVTITGGTLTNVDSGQTIPLDNLTHLPVTVTTNSSGAATLSVGGRIAISGNQEAGTYSGTYVVTVNY